MRVRLRSVGTGDVRAEVEFNADLRPDRPAVSVRLRVCQ